MGSHDSRGCVSVLSFNSFLKPLLLCKQTFSFEIIFLYFLLPFLILRKKVDSWVVSKLTLIENSVLACCTSDLTWNRLRLNPHIIFMFFHDAINPGARLIKWLSTERVVFLCLRLTGCHENALKLIFAFHLLSEDQRKRS